MSSRKRGRKRPEDITDPVLKRIFSVTGWRDQAELCRALGREESTLSRWLIHGKPIDDDWLYQICYLFPVRIDWLKTGEGLRDRPLAVDMLSGDLQEVLRLGRDLSLDLKGTLAGCARLLTGSDEKARQGLVGYVDGFEHLYRLSQRMRDATPNDPTEVP